MSHTSGRGFAVALGAAAAGVVVWSTIIERQLFTVRRHTLPLLPAGTAPVRILQLSDLHLAPWQNGKIDWVRSLAELRPDLVVLTGDLLGHLDAIPALERALRPFAELGIPGVFVHGSNDYYGPIAKNPMRYLREPSRKSTRHPDIDNARLTRMLSDELGFTGLNNDATSLELRGQRFELFGMNDPHIGYDDAAKMRSALDHTRAQHESADGPAPTRIGVVHAPYQAPLGALLAGGAELILAGHTHGGQVRVPGLGALTANCDLPVSQARGLSVWYDAHRAAFLNVSAGLGNSIYAPVRFACRPEASLLVLEAA
ncbi:MULTISPECIES: metallophosphoesterase [unclassified Leucobacter]|uniref:metallophosphoesterase n=1 Tax=unclassified Leucobacter TaxID=2621730 RepID=UPI00165DA96A|nr:metallophosphoesterase [Leucobacter sp. cx-87]